VEACVLVSSGWFSVGVSDKRIIIDVNENRMGTVLVDDKFLSRVEMSSYVNDHDDTITIRCRIHVFDNQQWEGDGTPVIVCFALLFIAFFCTLRIFIHQNNM